MSLLCGAHTLQKKPMSTQLGQRAAFQADLMWPVGSTIKIYIFDSSQIQIITQSQFRSADFLNNTIIKGALTAAEQDAYVRLSSLRPPHTLDDYEVTQLNELNEKINNKLKMYIYWQNPPTMSDSDQTKFLDPLYKTLQGKVDPALLIKTVVTERLAPLVNLKLQFTDNVRDSTIRVNFDSTRGCNSLIGTDNLRSSQGLVWNYPSDKPTMNYAWLDVATVLHEFCHALGMVHEHQNPNNNPIQWNVPAVLCYYRQKEGWSDTVTKRNVIDRFKISEINGSDYDKASIMIYAFDAKETLPEVCLSDSNQVLYQKDTQVPITLDGVSVNPNYKLSNSDIEWLKNIYPASGTRDPNVIKNLPKTVLPTDVFDPKSISTIGSETLEYFKANWKLYAGIAGALVGLYVLYWIVQTFKSRPPRNQLGYSSHSPSPDS